MSYTANGVMIMFPKPPKRHLPSYVSTSVGAIDYIANQQNCSALSTAAMASGTLRAVPFWAPSRRGAVIGRIAVETTATSSGNNLRIGIYANVADPKSHYPGALLVDSGNISATAIALKTYASSLALVRNKLYWMMLNTSASITCRGLIVNGVSAFLGIADGVSGTINPYSCYISVASAFGAFPDPFPAGGAYVSGNVVTPGLRYQFTS
jgi:hypothetical protein